MIITKVKKQQQQKVNDIIMLWCHHVIVHGVPHSVILCSRLGTHVICCGLHGLRDGLT